MANEPRTSGVFNLGALGGDGAGVAGDANWNDVHLLLDFEGQSVTDHSGNATNLTVGNGSNTSSGTAVYGSGANAKNGSYSFHSSGTGTANPYIALADPQLGTGEFTLECWLKVSSASTYANLMTNEQQGTNPGYGFSWQVGGSGGMLLWNQWSLKVSGTTNVVDGNWHHVALTRNASSHVTLWVDGQKDHTNTVTDSGSYSITNSGTSPFLIGHNLFHANRHIAGYIDDVRITKGVCRYTDTTNGFTPPGALPQGGPVAGATRPTRRWGGMTGRSLVESTAASGDADWSNVTLLLRGDNSTLEDKSGSTHTNYLSWSGTPTYGTGKYGGAFHFSDASRYLNGPTTLETNDFQFGTGDFTIESWVYLPSGSNFNAGDKCLFETRGYGTGGWVWFFTGTGNNSIVQNYYISGAPVYATSNHLSPDTWHHVALVRSGSNITFWRDGVASTGGASNVGSTNFSQGTGNGFHIGQRYDAVATTSLTGLVDDFRITTGVARDIAADWAAGLYNSPLPQGPAVAASTTLPTTGVLSLPELLQASYGVGASGFIGATFDALIIGGGGGGGLNQFTGYRDIGGGGGAEVAALTAQTLANTAYSITIGGGGTKQTVVDVSTPTGGDGGQTTAFGTTAKGGGGGFGHAAASPYVWYAAYSPAVQGGGGSPTSLDNRATSGYTYSGNYHTSSSAATSLPGNHGGGASGAVVNLGTAPTAPGPGVSSTITGTTTEYGIGGWGGYGTGYPDHTDFGCGGRGDGRPSTAGGDGLPGALILRVYGQTKSQAEVEAMITSATNLTVSVAADGADTIVTLSPTTTTTAASCTFTPA